MDHWFMKWSEPPRALRNVKSPRARENFLPMTITLRLDYAAFDNLKDLANCAPRGLDPGRPGWERDLADTLRATLLDVVRRGRMLVTSVALGKDGYQPIVELNADVKHGRDG